MDKNEQINQATESRPMPSFQEEMDDEINLIDLIYPIYQRRKFIICFCLIVAIATGIWGKFLPKTYEATAVILPVSDQKSSTLTSLSSTLEMFGLSGVGSSTSTSTKSFEAVLKSKELAGKVLRRYNYFSMMGISAKGENSSIKSLAQRVTVTTSKTTPTMSVTIQDQDPVFASDLANSYIKALDRYNLTYSFTTARSLREYIEKRMDEADKELNQAQVELREFQEKNNAISISQQAAATLEVLGQMEAQRVALEVQKATKEKFYKGPHIQIEQLEAQMEALQKNIDSLTYSETGSVPIKNEEGKVEFYIPLTRVPGLNFEESRLLLKVKAKTGVVTLLTTQLEQARLDEAKDMPTINVLEWSYPPNNPVKPKIKNNVMLSIVVSFFIGIFIVFFMEFIHRMDQDPETAPKWLEMKNGIVGLLRFKKR